MIVLYIIGGFVFMVLAVYLIDKREKMSRSIYQLKQQKDQINALNKQLDDVIQQLNDTEENIQKVNSISNKILSYRK